VAADRRFIVLDSRKNDAGSVGCGNHGHVPFSEGNIICVKFIEDYIDTYNASCNRELAGRFNAALDATQNKYPEVWSDEGMIKLVISYFLSTGTKCILEGEDDYACIDASFAKSFEQYMAAVLHEQGPTAVSIMDLYELQYGDIHTLVKYLRKRIPCKCLDEKYKEVKSVTKMGICCNPECKLPDKRNVERCTMLCCIRCRRANYCSRDCQKDHWHTHKNVCNILVAEQAEFESKQQSR
jgi:hypothetical protein